eukprot:gb/GECH01010155.1/.p1 GENE.gb/GECH01010155.1/~~gb/GECH01010155.1/.p1  ORF type:complete len:594 (+),score=105.79 gb/GECH01010155.1/:1-1782(+)
MLIKIPRIRMKNYSKKEIHDLKTNENKRSNITFDESRVNELLRNKNQLQQQLVQKQTKIENLKEFYRREAFYLRVRADHILEQLEDEKEENSRRQNIIEDLQLRNRDLKQRYNRTQEQFEEHRYELEDATRFYKRKIHNLKQSRNQIKKNYRDKKHELNVLIDEYNNMMQNGDDDDDEESYESDESDGTYEDDEYHDGSNEDECFDDEYTRWWDLNDSNIVERFFLEPDSDEFQKPLDSTKEECLQLAFVGDRVLSLLVTQELHEALPLVDRHVKTRLVSQLVSNEFLDIYAQNCLRIDDTLHQCGIIHHHSSMPDRASIVEALLAHVFIQHGLTIARRHVQHLILYFCQKQSNENQPIDVLQERETKMWKNMKRQLEMRGYESPAMEIGFLVMGKRSQHKDPYHLDMRIEWECGVSIRLHRTAEIGQIPFKCVSHNGDDSDDGSSSDEDVSTFTKVISNINYGDKISDAINQLVTSFTQNIGVIDRSIEDPQMEKTLILMDDEFCTSQAVEPLFKDQRRRPFQLIKRSSSFPGYSSPLTPLSKIGPGCGHPPYHACGSPVNRFTDDVCLGWYYCPRYLNGRHTCREWHKIVN